MDYMGKRLDPGGPMVGKGFSCQWPSDVLLLVLRYQLADALLLLVSVGRSGRSA